MKTSADGEKISESRRHLKIEILEILQDDDNFSIDGVFAEKKIKRDGKKRKKG